MNRKRFDDQFDAAIARALTPDSLIRAPLGLADDIRAQAARTPQRRRWLSSPRVLGLPLPAPALLWLMLLALLTALAVAIALSQLHSQPGIPTYHGGPSRNGVMPGPGPVGLPEQVWTVQRRGSIPFTVMPTVVGSRVFVADDGGGLAALDEISGEVLWEHQFDAPILSSPVVAGGFVIAASQSGEIASLDVKTGAPRWPPVQVPGPVSGSLAELDGIVYVGTEAGTLYARNAADGSEQWRTDLGAASSRGAAVAAGVLFVPAEGHMIAIALRDGSILWDQPLGDGNVGTPSVANGTVFVGRGILALDGAHDIVALRTADGIELWPFASETGAQLHVGAVDAGTVYANGEDGIVRAVDWSDGSLRWSLDTGTRISTLAALVGGTLFVTNEAGSIDAIDTATGNLEWSLPVEGRPTMPVVIDGRIFVGTSFGQVISYGNSH